MNWSISAAVWNLTSSISRFRSSVAFRATSASIALSGSLVASTQPRAVARRNPRTVSGFSVANSETVRGFLRATARGWVEATNDPESAIDALVARNATLERNREIELVKFRTAADVLQFTDHVRQAGWGNHDRDRWTRLGETLSETDLLEGPIDLSTIWTNEYFDTDADAIGNYAALIGR